MFIITGAQIGSQRSKPEMVVSNGFRPQIYLSTNTMHANLITAVQLNGSFKEKHSINGNRRAPYYGYTENVRYP